MNPTIIGIAFHGSVEFGHPASVGGLIVNTAKEIAKREFSIKIFCDSSNSFENASYIPKNIKIYPYKVIGTKRISKLHAWAKIAWISRAVSISNAHIIHIHQRPELVVGYSLLKNTGSSLIFHVNSHPDCWIGSRFERAIMKPDLIISASKFIQERLLKRFPRLSRKIEVLYNGVNTRTFKPIPSREKGNKEGEKFRVFFAGNIWLEKGFDILLESAKVLAREGVEFIVAGPFDPNSDLLHREFHERTPNNVKYLGCVMHDDLSSLYANADVTVVPSRWEDPCPLVIKESMSCGTPVIGSNIGGIPELIEDGKTGMLIAPNSAKELINAIRWCKTHPKRLREMRKEARMDALKFDWREIANDLRKKYEMLLEKKRRSGLDD